MDGEGGIIISATTDGFLTNLKDLDKYTSGDYSRLNLPYTHEFGKFRSSLGFAPQPLELKVVEDKGVISLKTRGQVGLSGNFAALTGFNRGIYASPAELVEVMKESMQTGKRIRYPANRLGSANDVVKRSGHVTMIPLEKVYKLTYDNRRCVSEKVGDYYDTEPFTKASSSEFVRALGNLSVSKYTQKNPWTLNITKDKDTFQRAFMRSVIRLMSQSPSKFGVESFSRDDICHALLLVFDVSVTPNYVTKQKKAEFIPHSVPVSVKTRESKRSLANLYPQLDVNIFFAR